MKRILTYSEAINEATSQMMEQDKSVFIIGEGVPDPKGIFGTTKGLREKFGEKRVSDMPVSENALTGMCIGAAISGSRPILTHQRIDFSLLSLDQIINNAAKLHYMFGGQFNIPLVIRMIIGRGWGQGAQHSQNLQALFTHIPGLKVVMPSTAYDAKGLLISSIKDNNTVIFLEHRWLHNTNGDVPEEEYSVPLGKAKVVKEGNELTVVATSLMTLEVLKISKLTGLSLEIIDVRTLKPLDESTIIESVRKTGKLLVLDLGYEFCGFASQVISTVAEDCFEKLNIPPQKMTLPDSPTPTSRGLTRYYYPQTRDILLKILEMTEHLDSEDEFLEKLSLLEKNKRYDVPDSSFKGPF